MTNHSKLYQNIHAYKLEIDITETYCPVCHRKHLKMNTTGDISCSCGYISSISHEYAAGLKVNNQIHFKINKIKPESINEDSEEEA